MTFLKLPQVIRNELKFNKAGSNYFNSNEFKTSAKHNISNQSIEININTQYSKRNVNMSKKMSELKKNYVSPYSQKIIFNNIKI